MARDSLDEWIYFLKSGTVLDEFTAKGIMRARQVFDLMGMPRSERLAYDHWNDARRKQEGMDAEKVRVARFEGREEGREAERIALARRLLELHDEVTVAELTGLSVDEVASLRS